MSQARAQATFTPLGELPGGAFYSVAYGVSPDGIVVVGESQSTIGSPSARPAEAFRWTATDGIVGLGDLPNGEYFSLGIGASTAGSVVVGVAFSANGEEAFRWTHAGGMVGLGDLPGGRFESIATNVSPDGSIVVGRGRSTNGYEAFRWTIGEGMIGLGDLQGGLFSSGASDMSVDGSVVVGTGTGILGIHEAFRWTARSGMIELGDLPGGDYESGASAVSQDGSVVVGGSRSAPDNFYQAFRWTANHGMFGLGDLPGGNFESYAGGVLADGSIVVGESESTIGSEAFYWSESSGMLSLRSLLLSQGAANVSDWTLARATAVSDDGLTIVGYGLNPSGGTEAWIATVPEPPTIVLAALAFFGCISRLARRAR